jgi:hypothetical protein
MRGCAETGRRDPVTGKGVCYDPRLEFHQVRKKTLMDCLCGTVRSNSCIMNLTQVLIQSRYRRDHHVEGEDRGRTIWTLAVDRFWHRHGEIRGKSLCARDVVMHRL